MVSHVSSEFSELYLLRTILEEQLGNNRSIHNLLATAVHAILIDSGFVLLDPISGLKIDHFHLPDSSFYYSLPQLFRFDHETGPRFTDHVFLKFQTLTHFLQVYGSLDKRDSGLYRLSLDEHLFVPTLDSLWSLSYSKREVLKLWKIVKDELAFPLLIDLCYGSGLSLPGCLMSLPPELKLKVLDSLPGIDIARVSCVCSDMRSVASDNDLWRRKVEEEFGDCVGAGMSDRKEAFRMCWKLKQDRCWAEIFCPTAWGVKI